MAASAQVNPESAPGPEQGGTTDKYEAYLGAAYTRDRQIPLTVSYSGLVGGQGSLARDWGKYFQLLGSVDYYSLGTGRGYLPDKGHPTIYTFLVGPAIHANVYGKLSGQVFGELGGEHTGGENMTPSISFAGGFGGSVAWNFTRNLAVELSADRVGASFSLPGNTSQLGYSTDRTWNARATMGVVYRFSGFKF